MTHPTDLADALEAWANSNHVRDLYQGATSLSEALRQAAEALRACNGGADREAMPDADSVARAEYLRGRNEALQEAAKVADKKAIKHTKSAETNAEPQRRREIAMAMACLTVSKNIRALEEKGPDHD